MTVIRRPVPRLPGSLLGGCGRDDRDRAVRVEQDRLGDRAHHAGGREQPAPVTATTTSEASQDAPTR